MYIAGTIGRDPGEYQNMLTGLEIGKDSVISVIDYTKYLALTLDGVVVKEQNINLYNGVSDPRSRPLCLWQDSFIIFYSELQSVRNLEMQEKEGCFKQGYLWLSFRKEWPGIIDAVKVNLGTEE